MVKRFNRIFFHKNERDTGVIDLDVPLFSDDTVIDLKGKIFKHLDIYPYHSYVWFKIHRDDNLAKNMLYKFYYNTIKYDTEEGETWIRKDKVKDGFNRLGLGNLDKYPSPKDEERYTIDYFKRKDIIDLVSKRLQHRGVGYFIDNKNYIYNVPSANPFNVDVELLLLPKSKKYIDETNITLDYYGNITEIHVVDGKMLDDSIRNRYCPGCELEASTEMINLYETILFPKLKYVNGYRNINGKSYIIKKSLNNFVIQLNDIITFPKHLDFDSIFNSLPSSKDMPYIEMINNLTGEKIHKICLDPDTTIPFVDEDVLTEWIRNENKDSSNFILIKLLTHKKAIDNYGDIRIYKNGKIEFESDIVEFEFKNLNEENPLFDNVISSINKIVKFMNVDYTKFITDSIKNSDSVKILNYIPKEVLSLSKTSGYNKIISMANLNIFFKFNKRLDPRFFPPFINCLHPFVKIENPELILNKKIRFRTSMIDNFDKVGIINNISLRGKYNISSTISIDDIHVKDQLISVKGGDIVWSIGEITDTDVTLRHFKKGTNEILAKKSIQKNTLKNYRLLYEDVPVYNILNNDSDLEKINMIWKRVNNYKSLSNLGKEILEYISKGFLKEKDEGSEDDNSIRRLLTIRHGSITKEELNEQIIKIRRDGKKNTIDGHSGIQLSVDLNGIVDTNKDKTKSYIYKINIKNIDDLNKIDDICNFFNNLFYTYDVWYNSYIRTTVKVVCKNEIDGIESKGGPDYEICNEINYVDNRNMIALCTKCKKPLNIVGDSVDIFKTEGEAGDDFKKIVDEFDFQMDFDVVDKSFKCERITGKVKKDDITISSSDDSDSDESDGEEDDIEDESDDIDWGIDFGSDDDDEEEGEEDVDEIQNEISTKCPGEIGDYKSPEDWGKLRKDEIMIMSYEEANLVKEDERMRDKFILSKLYERDPLLFKWQRVNFDPYSRLCQPTDRYPIILTDSEKTDLDQRVTDKISDPYADEDASSCSRENGNSDNCGSIKYGSTDKKQHWFICPKIWCPACKISISEDRIVDKDRCPNCNRQVVDRSKWYNDEEGKPVYGWPGFENSSRHPKNLWIPCCFNSISNGKPKPQVSNRIKDAFGIKNNIKPKNQKYIIKLKSKILERGRFGVLEDNINDLFKNEDINKEDISTLPSTSDKKKGKKQKNIPEKLNLFFRYGLGNSFENRDFLSLIANIYSNIHNVDFNKVDLIKQIISGITKKDFVNCNRGILEILFRDIQDNISPFQNFIEYLTSKEVRNGNIHYQYLWDLCTRPNKWLFKKGIKLILIDGDNTDDANIICQPFPVNKYDSDIYVLAIRYKSGNGYIFEPIYNVTAKHMEGTVFTEPDNPGHNVYMKLYKRVSNCKITPNFNLLAHIYKRRGAMATPIGFPLYNLKVIKMMFKYKKKIYEIEHYIRDEYNKIIGLALSSAVAPVKKDGSKTLFFVPIYPSGPIEGEMKHINDVKFTDFYNSQYFLEKIYREVIYRRDNNVIRVNVLPTEIILNNSGNKIIAIVSNSNSIIPVKDTEINSDNIKEGFFHYRDINDNERVIKISKRKYYKKLDTYIRERPIGILQYSKEKSVEHTVNKLSFKIKTIIVDDELIFIVFEDKSGESIMIPFTNNVKNMNYLIGLDKKIIKSNIINWIRDNNIVNYEIENVLNMYKKVTDKYNLHIRPVRYVMKNNKEVCGLVLENGLEIPVKCTNIIDVIYEINHEYHILDSVDNIDYYYDLEKKDERIRKIAMLKYEEEIFNIIKYEFSNYLQTEAGRVVRKEIENILDNVFDLLHTKLARNKIYNILNNYLKKHSINTKSTALIERGLENYNVPSFREKYAEERAGITDIDKCNNNPHYYYKKGSIKTKSGKNMKVKNSGCKIVIPSENLIHKDIKKNKNNKIYRIVDEIIRDKNIRMEILNGLVPKSIVDDKYVPLNKGEVVFLTNKDSNIEERLILLYKKNISQNLRRDEYGEVVDTFDTAKPEEIEGDTKNINISKSLTYLDNKTITLLLIGTGKRGNLF